MTPFTAGLRRGFYQSITFLEQASLSLPCLQMFLLTYLGNVLYVRMSGGKWFKTWQTIYHFLTPHQKGKIHDINSTKIREERCKSVSCLCFPDVAKQCRYETCSQKRRPRVLSSIGGVCRCMHRPSPHQTCVPSVTLTAGRDGLPECATDGKVTRLLFGKSCRPQLYLSLYDLNG